MNEILLNWLVALAVILLVFAGLSCVIRAAVRSAVKDLLREMAKELWKNENQE